MKNSELQNEYDASGRGFRAKQFITYCLLLFALITVLGVPTVIYFEKQRLEIIVERQKANLEAGYRDVIVLLDQAVRDVLKLSELAELLELVEAPEEERLRSQAERYFHYTVQRNPQYAQLRYIDETGHERIRIDGAGQQAYVVPKNQLQDKSQRYYFTKTMQLTKGSFFKSPFDLNVEKGEIEQPLRPMLRVAVPVDSGSGKRRGVIVLNYNGQWLLDVLELSATAPAYAMLLNKKGFWLKSHKKQDEWGFMLGKPNLTMAKVYPTLWQKIKVSDHGVENHQTGLYIFDTIEPLQELAYLTSDQLETATSNPSLADSSYRWKLLHFIPAQQLRAQALYNQPLFIGLAIVLYSVLTGIAWLLALLNHRNRLATLRLLKETAIREEEFRNYLESAPDGVLVTDTKGIIQRVNTKLESLLGYSREELIGSPVEIIAPHALEPRANGVRENFFRNTEVAIGSGDEVEIRVKNKDGQTLPVNVSIKVIASPDGRQIIGAMRDVSMVKETERKLNEAIKTAESANLAKSNFLANMSHEIRTPLNALLGSAYLLSIDRKLDRASAEQVARINVAGQSLLAIINDILDLSKIEAGEFVLERVPMRLTSVLMDVEAVCSGLAESKAVELDIAELDKDIESEVIGDPVRLHQILLNLVNNAIKFTQQGSVKIALRKIDPPPANQFKAQLGRDIEWVEFAVCDTGIGIDPNVIDTLFEGFRQADSSVTRIFGGSGLGLTIVRQLCHAMNGDVTVQSQLGEGSCFMVQLPFTCATNEEMERAGLRAKSLEVLIVEDDANQRQLLLSMCQKLGWQAEAVDSGEALVARYNERESAGQPVDCLIIDWQLPGIDGLKALDAIVNDPSCQRVPGALMVTAYDMIELQKSPHQHLPDAILTKPIDLSQLFNEMNQAFSKRFGTSHQLASSSLLGRQEELQWLCGVHILLVDDSEMNIDVATAILQREGAIIYSVNNGQQALTWLEDPENKVDVVLMDVQMPVMDGNTATQAIRQIPRLIKLPIIALTAGALMTERVKSIESGMNDYLTKPFEPERMIRMIRQYAELKLKHSLPVLERRSTQGEKTTDIEWPEIAGIDTAAVRHRTNNDLHFFRRLLSRLISEYEQFRKPEPFPQESQDRAVMAALVHKLAGNAGLLGAEQLCESAKLFERALRDNSSEQVSQLYQDFTGIFQSLVAAAEPVLASLSAELNAQADSDSEDSGPPDIDRLLIELKAHKFTAVQYYRAEQPKLRKLLDREQFNQLDEAINTLNFEMAIAVLAPFHKQGLNSDE